MCRLKVGMLYLRITVSEYFRIIYLSFEAFQVPRQNVCIIDRSRPCQQAVNTFAT